MNDLGSKHGNIGFLLPPMEKSAFFRTVVFDGALPRKTFSMGEAHEKEVLPRMQEDLQVKPAF